jgi:hypothetical protein
LGFDEMALHTKPGGSTERREGWRKENEKRNGERETIGGKGKEKRKNKKWLDKIF